MTRDIFLNHEIKIPHGQEERVEALKWWRGLSFTMKQYYSGAKNPLSLTGREVHIIYKRR